MRFLFVDFSFGIRFTGYYLWQNFIQVRNYVSFLKQEQDTGHSAWWIFLQTKGVAGLFDCHCHLPFLVTIKGFPGRRICLIFTTVILGLVAGHLDFVITISLKNFLNTIVCTLHSHTLCLYESSDLNVHLRLQRRWWIVFHGICLRKMPQNHAGLRPTNRNLLLRVTHVTALQKLPSSRKRWPLLTGPLAIVCLTVKLRTISIPWHQANSGQNLIILISRRQMKSLHEGLVTQETSIWTPSAPWKMDPSQNCGWTRQGCLLALVSKCLNTGEGTLSAEEEKYQPARLHSRLFQSQQRGALWLNHQTAIQGISFFPF